MPTHSVCHKGQNICAEGLYLKAGPLLQLNIDQRLGSKGKVFIPVGKKLFLLGKAPRPGRAAFRRVGLEGHAPKNKGYAPAAHKLRLVEVGPGKHCILGQITTGAHAQHLVKIAG